MLEVAGTTASANPSIRHLGDDVAEHVYTGLPSHPLAFSHTHTPTQRQAFFTAPILVLPRETVVFGI